VAPSEKTKGPSADLILAWYDRHARKLPWRVGPKDRAQGARPDPYRVWLSEVMLQQTTVPAVKGYFERFVARWPDVAALAAAPREEVLKEWAGLGYYARARNLKACADMVAGKLGGEFPACSAGLEELPGIGGYTAAAIAAIAFDEPAVVVDANIERVLSRAFAIETPLPAAKKVIREHQARLTPRYRAGDYAQGLMDLGTAICTPKRPACSLCPWEDSCAAHAIGAEERYPVKAAKAERPTRYGAAFVAVRRDGAVLLRQRGESGLLGGMSEVPGSEWQIRISELNPIADAPVEADWRLVAQPIVHVFTHFRLILTVYRGDLDLDVPSPPGSWWSVPRELPGEALPSLMKKVIEAAAPGATKRQTRAA
jgi:A/G-specific adenine glycosylase